jgi:hypothetical protein
MEEKHAQPSPLSALCDQMQGRAGQAGQGRAGRAGQGRANTSRVYTREVSEQRAHRRASTDGTSALRGRDSLETFLAKG